jgi:catechol 2,3-dioxygenase
MALKGVLRPGYIQIRVTDLKAALTHYVDRVGLHEVSREADGRVYLRAWDEFDRHSIVLRQADMPGTVHWAQLPGAGGRIAVAATSFRNAGGIW